MDQKFYCLKVAGAAGEGIMSTGLLFSKLCARQGYYIFDYTEYPSLITGGHNTYQVNFSNSPVYCQSKKTDVLIALNKQSLELHEDELSPDSIVIFDSSKSRVEIADFNLGCKTLDVPMVKLAVEAGGKEIMANNVSVGVACYLFGFDLESLKELIANVFAGKDEAIITENQKAAQAGYDFAKNANMSFASLEKQNLEHVITASGNEAVGLGAISGGMQFYAAYPMTPSSSLLTFMAETASKANIVVKHAEDEISVANMALGASYGGVRAMVGTSGGGFCYMTEALGFAGIAELPIVFLMGMRPGPALGMPTWTGQEDLNFVIYGGNGEFPRFVLAPGDGQEAFELSRKAQSLAEDYQVPVIILSDKQVAESRFPITLENEVFTNKRSGFVQDPRADETGFFPRYKLTESNISPRSIPGQAGGSALTNSYEHNEYGFSAEEGDVKSAQVKKRMQKHKGMELEVPKQFWEEEPNSAITFISFGSTKGTIREARKVLGAQGVASSHLNLSWLWPFPKQQVKESLQKSPKSVVVEGNFSGQLAALIAQETGVQVPLKLNRYDGRPFYKEDILNFVESLK